MQIKDLFAQLENYIAEGAPIRIDPTNILAARKTKRGLETAGIIGLTYNTEIDAWIIEVNDWESAGRQNFETLLLEKVNKSLSGKNIPYKIVPKPSKEIYGYIKNENIVDYDLIHTTDKINNKAADNMS